ncbi:PhzF family phenazine biosynthesis isomerase [Nibribacter ruber]|uniref:PhzF family phenazine biosynthesis isomerase n=1 Tax=Nibribacter ruber TaxID=2698458 RepID=A0A6P1NWL5_9BACT|nr:PhzF family phenazine biosynthesis protein [Nibribacter ruber]QHL86619.1 PhzF family phenazine biosynthesis isomerase [Nibribacter ruber]
MQIKTYIIDSFTQEPFKGNPAGVCLLDSELAPPLMQSIASEMNLSETAFLVPAPESDDHFHIRYFTPKVEIAFCGHATLASAKVVLDRLSLSKATFTTGQGLQLQVSQEEDGGILMHFPLYAPAAKEPLPEIYAALDLSPDDCVGVFYAEPLTLLIVQLKKHKTLLEVKPDYKKLIQEAPYLKGLALTSPSEDPAYDFCSRCFWPWVGINEDPVTGSAHSALAPFWAFILGKTQLNAYQASARGGSMHLTLQPAKSLVEVRSHAQIVLEGVLFV